MSILSWLSNLFTGFSPEEQLVADVAKELKRRGIEGCSFDPQTYTMVVRDAKVGLQNLFLEWRLRRRREKAALVRRFVDGILSTPRELPAYDVAAEKLVPLVRSRTAICLLLLEGQARGAPPGTVAETAWLPLTSDLVTAVGIDYDDSISRMTRADLGHFGVTPEQVFSARSKTSRSARRRTSSSRPAVACRPASTIPTRLPTINPRCCCCPSGFRNSRKALAI